jgi:MFS family permease
MSAVSAPPAAVVSTARVAVFTAFAVNGAAFAAFASRVPDIKHELGLSAGQLGLTLLAASLGSVIGLPLSGWIVHRLGAARTVVGAAVVQSVGLLGVGLGVDVAHNRAAVMAGLVLVGVGTGVFDVAMNLEGAEVERFLGRAIMPHFHAAFSGGTVVSALIGAGLSFLHVPVAVHLAGVVVLLLVVTPWFLRAFLPRSVETDETGAEVRSDAGIGAAWREPRTLLIGVFVLCAAFTEGTGNDWLGVAVIDGYHTSAVIGTSVFAVFLAAMTTARWFGPVAIDRFGRVPVLRISVGLALVGLVLVVIGAALPVAYLGTLLWGAGAALGFPVGMSAASDDPALAPRRVSVVSSIGYTAFLAGPPVIGFLGSHVGVLRALSVAAALLALATVIVPVTREPDREAGIIEPARR